MKKIGIYKAIRDQLRRVDVSEIEIVKFFARPEVARGVAAVSELPESQSSFTVTIDKKYKTIHLHVTLERPYTFCRIGIKDGFETQQCQRVRQVILDDSYVLERKAPTPPSTPPNTIAGTLIARKLHQHRRRRQQLAEQKTPPIPSSVGSAVPSVSPHLSREASPAEQSLAILLKQTLVLETQREMEWQSAQPIMKKNMRFLMMANQSCSGNCSPDPFCLTPEGGIDLEKFRRGICVFVKCDGV